MVTINIDKSIKSNLKHRKEILKKVLILKGWNVSKEGNLILKTRGEDKYIKSYSEYAHNFKPWWGKFLNLK